MARTYAIKEIFQSGGVGSPGRIRLADAVGDVTNSFAGKFYRNSVGATQPGYTVAPSPGYSFVQATTFDIINNPSYAGRYTTYSPIDAPDSTLNPSSQYSAPNTTIRVLEVVGPTLGTSPTDNLNTGSVTNISTYLITIVGEPVLVIPPAVLLENRPIDMIGRNGTPWGEPVTQNLVDIVQNFSSTTAPLSPFIGQTWYNIGASPSPRFELWNGTTWVVLATVAPGSNSTVRVTQAVATTSWTVTHNLALLAPFVCLYQVFVDTGGGVYEHMLPSDVTFTSLNSFTVTFTTPQSGIVLIRA